MRFHSSAQESAILPFVLLTVHLCCVTCRACLPSDRVRCPKLNVGVNEIIPNPVCLAQGLDPYEYSLSKVWSLRVNYGSQDLTAASVIKENLLFAQGGEFAPNTVYVHLDDQIATNDEVLFLLNLALR